MAPPGEARAAGWLDGLTSEQRREVVSAGVTRRLARGEALFHQGEPAETLCLVEAGRLKLAQTSAGGEVVAVRLTGPGELCAAIAVLDGKAYPFTASAVEPTLVRLWSRRVLRELFARIPRLQTGVLEVVGAHTRESLDRLREVATEPVAQRIARALLRLTRRAGQPEGAGRLVVDVTLQDLAELSATTLYTVSRVLADWQAEGVLTKTRGRVLVRSEPRLRAHAEGAAPGAPRSS